MDNLTIALIVLGLVVLNGMYVAAEFVLVSVPKTTVQARAREGDRLAARIQRMLRNPRLQDKYFAATQLGVTFASLGLGMYGEHAVAQKLIPLFESLGDASAVTAHVVSSALAVALMTYLHVVLGEMVPKSMALAGPLRAAPFVVPFALFTRALLTPLVGTLEWTSNRLLRLVGIDRSKVGESAHHTAEDLVHIVERSREGGKLGGEAGRALAEMFDFSNLKADDVMVPRVAIHAIPMGAGVEEIGRVLSEGQHTRYPVYEEDLDRIVGMAHIRDLLRLLHHNQALTADLVRPITFVPETMELDRVLGAMRRDKTHAVIVMDEQGGTAGMLTVKNLFEEVVGTMLEGEVDIEGRIEAYRDEAGRLHVYGTLRLAELEEVLGEDLPEIDAETVSGLVLLLLGRPARRWDSVVHGPIRFVVVGTEGRGVKECLVDRAPGAQTHSTSPSGSR